MGSTDTDKATNCNRLTGSDGRCTFVTGNKCSVAAGCATYTLTSFDACVLRRNAAGALCGFSSADTTKCAERACD